MLCACRHSSPLGGSTLTTSAPKSDRITAALGPAMKLARSTTLSPEKMLSPAMDSLRRLCSREIRTPFFEERREGFPRLRRPHPGSELLRLDSRRRSEEHTSELQSR